MPIRPLIQGGIALLLLSLSACSARPAIVDHEILARGSFSELTDSGEQYGVIRSRSELNTLYDQLFAGRLPTPPVPEIDFSRSLVVFVAMAQQPTAGYSIELLPPAVEGDTLVICTIFDVPPEESARATVLTRPFAVARVTRPQGLDTVRFVDEGGKVLAEISVE